MTLRDTMHGSPVMLWVVAALGAILSAVLLSGHGAGLIAGYNTASEAEKRKYDEKKLCRVTGAGTAVITVLILVSGLFADVLPAWFAYASVGIILLVSVGIIVLGNTVCKK